MATSKEKVMELELDMKTLLMPLSLILSAIIIALPISLSIYFGLRDSGLRAGVAGIASAWECDEASPLGTGCLMTYAQDLGIDTTKFKQCLDAKTYDNIIATELDYGNEIGITGTPSLFIGENKGDKMSGFDIGAGATLTDVQNLVSVVETKGIEEAAKTKRASLEADLKNYETQLRDYYTQQGQTGDALQKSVADGLVQRKADIDNETKVRDLVYGNAMLRGNTSAKTVLMEFSDYECPYCKKFAQAAGNDIKTQLVDAGKLLFVYHDFPLESIHPSARKGSNAVRCAGEQNKYFEYHDKIFGVDTAN